MYIRRVSGNRTAGIIIIALLLLPPLAVILWSLYSGGMMYAAASCAVILAGMGIYVALRIQLTVFIYEISDDEKPGQYDLIIRSQCGKRIRTECRVALSGKFEEKEYRRQKGESVIRYCPCFCEGETRLFRPDEANGKYLLAISADSEMLGVMKTLGIEL